MKCNFKLCIGPSNPDLLIALGLISMQDIPNSC